MKLLALFSIVVAVIAVLLVARGSQGPLVHMLLATALGTGLSVLLAGALMSLFFLSARSGPEAHANKLEKDEISE
jgi:RsiW-degrading membrane proteinase PrsW (M82 family)